MDQLLSMFGVQVRQVRRFLPAGECWLLFLLVCLWSDCVLADTVVQPHDYPQSLQRELNTLLDARAADSKDPDTLLRLAGLYLDMGDNLFNDTPSRIKAYEEGTRAAHRALEFREADAQAHFLYAANLGSAMQLKGMLASALGVRDLKTHTARSLELKKDHAAALHMMGMLLEELPRLLGGDREAALDHVQRAVMVSPGFAHARLDLAKMYLKRHDSERARQELRAIVTMEQPTDPYAWKRREKPEAEQLLKTIDSGKPAIP